MAVLPIHYPKELLTALDLLAVEVWGPPGAPRGDAAGRIQTYVCPVARNALAFLASGGADVVDAALFPHTCDSIQQLATLAADFGGWSKPALTFLHPKGFGRPSSRRFLAEELRALAGKLEAVAGRRLEPERLSSAIRLHREIDAHRAALLDGRATLPLDDPDLYALLRRGEWLWPEDHLAELRDARRLLGTAARRDGVPVLVTGYVPEPIGALAVLNAAGAYVAADDYAAVGRRIVREQDDAIADPWDALVARYAAAPPCPTRAADQDARMRYLEGLLERSGARGVIVHVVKFCEPELFDVPAIRRTFAARGVPLLQLEGELERQLSGQTVTRLEAFAELLSGPGGRA
ncbi:2-hydroxyacyl-CoA dehydratase subunit D [Anaeromyxobacter oryzae]|uniref:2-hydroxyacyl-CoA dehydratase subunit D n=1 Tax=Anaeromyxobacter oryzae TaxID=2918170 RepID=UPI0020C088F9|nr:2-hydroxyacyl-CoA dehydratase family protein [Anaeromyxobacter oryzae]